MAGQGEKAVPRFRTPTVASSARSRVASDSSASSIGNNIASRPSVGPRRVQTPHPSRRPRVASDSSSRSTESSQTSQQSLPRFQAPTQASSARRVPSEDRDSGKENNGPGSATRTPISGAFLSQLGYILPRKCHHYYGILDGRTREQYMTSRLHTIHSTLPDHTFSFPNERTVDRSIAFPSLRRLCP